MKSCWNVLLIAALVMVGCGKGDRQVVEGTKPGDEPADKAYTLRVKNAADVGKQVTVRATRKKAGALKSRDGMGINQETKIDDLDEDEFVESVIEKGDPAPKKYQRIYNKSSFTQNGKQLKRPYEGARVLFENTGESYLVNVEGGKIAPPDLIKLTEEAKYRPKKDLVQLLLPDKPVKVNDTWPLARAVLEEVAGLAGRGVDVDFEKSKGEAKLARVYSKDGRRFGVIEITVNEVLKGIGPFQFESPGSLNATGSFDGAIDGSSPAGAVNFKASVNGKGTFNVGGNKGNVSLIFDVTLGAETSGESPAK